MPACCALPLQTRTVGFGRVRDGGKRHHSGIVVCGCWYRVLCLVRRKVENKLLEMLNMRGRHKHKWDSLRQVLAEKVVYDDNNIRVWMAPDGSGQGLLYYAKQAQVRILCV